MFYAVKARYIPSAVPEFHRKLTDGTIARQKPDGQEIVKSMQRARIPAHATMGQRDYCREDESDGGVSGLWQLGRHPHG